MDEDLATLSREQLIDEVRKLRRGIRAHRDSSGQDLCWHHPALWALLPEKQDALPQVPDWPEFMKRMREVSSVARPAGTPRTAVLRKAVRGSTEQLGKPWEGCARQDSNLRPTA
jgi:hypothetical protein